MEFPNLTKFIEKHIPKEKRNICVHQLCVNPNVVSLGYYPTGRSCADDPHVLPEKLLVKISNKLNNKYKIEIRTSDEYGWESNAIVCKSIESVNELDNYFK